MEGAQNAGSGGMVARQSIAACCDGAAPMAAQQTLLDRATELRVHADRLVREAQRLEMLAKCLPGIMPVEAHIALNQLVNTARLSGG